MEVSIREPNIKSFVRLLQCASRFGDDLCMHAAVDKWELAVTNSSKSAYCLFTLKPAFFSRYKSLGTAAQQRRCVECKLYVKSVLSVLGKASALTSVERIELRIVDPEGGLRARTPDDDDEDATDDVRVMERSAVLELKLVQTHGITKKHILHLHSSDFLRVIVDPDSQPSGFQVAARSMRDWLDHFSIAFSSATSIANSGGVRGDSQLAWMFTDEEVRVKNFDTGGSYGGAAALSTEIKLSVKEFDMYEVFDGRQDLALPMREFKGALQLAEQLGMDLDFMFSEATQPLTISSTYVGLDKNGHEAELFTIFAAIATTKCEAFTSVSPSAPVPANGRQGHAEPSERTDRGTSVASAANESESSEATPLRKRKASEIPRSGRAPRASLSLTAQPPAADAERMVTVSFGAQAHASQGSQGSQGDPNGPEPLFLSSQSQSMRLTQQEVLELAGVGDIDLEALMDDADDDNLNDPAQAEPDDESNQPPPPRPSNQPEPLFAAAEDEGEPMDWDQSEFDNLPPNRMSTQQGAGRADPSQTPTEATQLLTQMQLEATQLLTQPELEHQPEPQPPKVVDESTFELDSDIFGDGPAPEDLAAPAPCDRPSEEVAGLSGGRSTRRTRQSTSVTETETSTEEFSAPPVTRSTRSTRRSSILPATTTETIDSAETGDDNEELEPDDIDPTQASGRKFESLFMD